MGRHHAGLHGDEHVCAGGGGEGKWQQQQTGRPPLTEPQHQATCVLISAQVATLVGAKALKCAFWRMQDFPLPTGGSITAGTWLDPSDGLLSQLPAQAVVNRFSPSPAGAVIFFCSFMLLCGLVLVNFVIGAIIDNFASSCQDDGLPVNKDSVDEFAQVCSCV